MGSPRDHLHIEKAGRVRVVPTTHGSSYPARAAEQGFIFQQFLLSSSYPARAAEQGFIFHQFLLLLLLLLSSFFFLLSTLQYLRDPMSDYAHYYVLRIFPPIPSTHF